LGGGVVVVEIGVDGAGEDGDDEEDDESC